VSDSTSRHAHILAICISTRKFSARDTTSSSRGLFTRAVDGLIRLELGVSGELSDPATWLSGLDDCYIYLVLDLACQR